ncbi:MAG TPA: site-specific integrase, partial [Deltaproteobacteria bacterium]|nr:site-specific integrase [Deltaproteobacteria bacterium]
PVVLQTTMRGKPTQFLTGYPQICYICTKCCNPRGRTRVARKRGRGYCLGLRASRQEGSRAFRHSYAVHLLRHGVPLTVVQRLVGHSSIETTAIYLAVVQRDVEEFVRKVQW